MENDKTVLVNEEKMNTKDMLEQAYMELGKEYYEGAYEDPLSQLLPLFEKINALKNDMFAKKRTEDRCPKCGKPIVAGDMFCGNCGEKIG